MVLVSLRGLLKMMALASIAVFLGFHALNGNHGLYALLQEQYRLSTLREKLTTVTQERQELEHRVSLMRDGSLDVDMLDEQARRTLGVTSKDEVMVVPEDQVQR